MSALSFDPWAALKLQSGDGTVAKAANPANPRVASPSRLAGLAGLAARPSGTCASDPPYDAGGLAGLAGLAAAPSPTCEISRSAELPAEEPDEDAFERACIQAEPELPPPGSAERARLDARHAAEVRGLLDAALVRPVSWSDPAARPSPGCWCRNCRGRRWWCENPARRPTTGWRCWTCHPPDWAGPGDVEVVQT